MTGREPRRLPPARRRAGPRLRLRARRRAHGRGGRHRRRPGDPHRDGDRARRTSSSSARATSEPLGATYLDEAGVEQPIVMGSYGIGPARIAAAAVEQHADEDGIAWPRALAPVRRRAGRARQSRHARSRRTPTGSTTSCARSAPTCSTTTATLGPGEKFADAELLGCPLRHHRRQAHAGAGGELELQVRRGREARGVPLEGAAEAVRRAVADAPVGGWRRPRDAPSARLTALTRRLLGLDRSGPPPAATLAGAPLRPWTIPNAIGFVRLALIPVFLVVALSSDGRRRRAAGDPLRGDRLGRLRRRDRGAHHAPVQPPRRADGPGHRPPARDLAASSSAGTSSCCRAGRWPCSSRASWRCSCSAATALKRGVELRINWPGRLAVAPVMGSLFFAMCGLRQARRGAALRRPARWRCPRPRCYLRDGLRGCARGAAAQHPQARRLRLQPAARLYSRAPPSDASGEPTRTMDDLSRPRLADGPGAEGPDPAAHRGGDSRSPTSAGSCTARSTSCAPSSSTACARSTRAART